MPRNQFMKFTNFKGALLEYMVRELLSTCGFLSVAPDGLYTYESQGLFFINGKGAAHDADVLMEPPVQMPFSYPSRVIFECKAYDSKVGLTFIRNALGLRNDINEFEVVTKESLKKRKNNRRSACAIEDRKRYNYHVGVASISDYTKPALEFAANNKITLLSLKWFLSNTIITDLNSINQKYINEIDEDHVKIIYAFFKDRKKDNDYEERNRDAKEYIQSNELIESILNAFNESITLSYVGLIESGDLIFLIPTEGARNLSTFENIHEERWGQVFQYHN